MSDCHAAANCVVCRCNIAKDVHTESAMNGMVEPSIVFNYVCKDISIEKDVIDILDDLNYGIDKSLNHFRSITLLFFMPPKFSSTFLQFSLCSLSITSTIVMMMHNSLCNTKVSILIVKGKIHRSKFPEFLNALHRSDNTQAQGNLLASLPKINLEWSMQS